MIGELLQPAHLLIIAAVLFFFFGGRWFALLGRSFNLALRNFRSSIRGSTQNK